MKTPPLRAREHDHRITRLVFFQQILCNPNLQGERIPYGFPIPVKELRLAGQCPGIDELRSSCSVMSENRLLTPTDLGLDRRVTERVLKTLDEARASVDRELIATCLRHTNFNISRSAEILGISHVKSLPIDQTSLI